MIKIITSDSPDDLEEKINKIPFKIKSVNVTAQSLHDNNLNDGSICNQWIEYIAIIVI